MNPINNTTKTPGVTTPGASFDTLFCLSPLDGRYHDKLDSLRPLLSEYGLIHFRVQAEIAWFKALTACPQIEEVPSLSSSAISFLDDLVKNFGAKEATQIKTIEKKTNHDVKAVEYFLKERFSEHPELKPLTEFIHFACTSEDINNVAYSLMLKAANDQVTELYGALKLKLSDMAKSYAKLPMLARTHGQSASPTTLGKEIKNVVARLERPLQQLATFKFKAKMNGAVGNFNAHVITYPEVNWLALSENLITGLGLEYNAFTTQIEPHDLYAEYFSILKIVHTILIDLARDMWGYNSLGYFKLKVVAGETGSSTMPHKVNPIDFENAEGNFGMSNAVLAHLADKLPISRWQRDLSDSTVLRNIGVGLGYGVLAILNLLKGLHKLEANEALILSDLDEQPAVLAEAIQTVMRRYGILEPYEKLKDLTRGKTVDLELLTAFIESQPLPADIKAKLKALTPRTYIGLAIELALKP